MKAKYRTIDLRTKKGFRKAEDLKSKGWKIASVGFDTIQMIRTSKGQANLLGIVCLVYLGFMLVVLLTIF